MQRVIQGYLSRIHLGVAYHDFTEEQMLAYFTRDNTRKIRFICGSFIAGILFFAIGQQYPSLFVPLGVLAFGASLVVGLTIVFAPRVPTDEEYDTWVQKKAEGELKKALEEVDQDDLPEVERDRLLCVQGYALPGTKDAKKYLREDIHWKVGKDGAKRYSINIFTYVLPLEHRIAAMTFHINAVNHSDHSQVIGEYFYSEIVFVRKAEENDQVTVDEVEYLYRTKSFILGTNDGHSVNVTIRSLPVSNASHLPTFDFIKPEVEQAIRRLRWHICSIKEKGA